MMPRRDFRVGRHEARCADLGVFDDSSRDVDCKPSIGSVKRCYIDARTALSAEPKPDRHGRRNRPIFIWLFDLNNRCAGFDGSEDPPSEMRRLTVTLKFFFGDQGPTGRMARFDAW